MRIAKGKFYRGKRGNVVRLVTDAEETYVNWVQVHGSTPGLEGTDARYKFEKWVKCEAPPYGDTPNG